MSNVDSSTTPPGTIGARDVGGSPLPASFCWTRFGTEAGETIDAIIQRKEEERVGNRGVFLWGIGNALGPSMRELLRVATAPELLFSPIRSKPRREDVAPATTVVWTAGRDLNGAVFSLPAGSVVTSRYSPGPRTPRHYALVCYSEAPLEFRPSAIALSVARLRNLLTNNVVGASQVTAVVRRVDSGVGAGGTSYPVAMRVRLVAPYLIELLGPKWHAGDARTVHPELPFGCHPEPGGLPSLVVHT